MKTSEKQPKKARGAYVAIAVKNLKKSGLTGQALEMAVNAVRGFKTSDIVKLPRKVSKTICEQLSKYKRVVVVNKSPKRFKVFSLEGYLSTQSASSKFAYKNKPWMHAASKRANALLKGALKSKVAVS